MFVRPAGVEQLYLTLIVIEYKMIDGGGFMSDTKRLQATLKSWTIDRLEQICKEKGISKSAAVALAIDKLWKEEHSDKK